MRADDVSVSYVTPVISLHFPVIMKNIPFTKINNLTALLISENVKLVVETPPGPRSQLPSHCSLSMVSSAPYHSEANRVLTGPETQPPSSEEARPTVLVTSQPSSLQN